MIQKVCQADKMNELTLSDMFFPNKVILFCSVVNSNIMW